MVEIFFSVTAVTAANSSQPPDGKTLLFYNNWIRLKEVITNLVLKYTEILMSNI